MIDVKTLFPMVKRLLPNESDKDILAGIAQFTKVHPDFNNAQALQALITAIKQMQGQKQPPMQPPAQFGQGMLGQIPTTGAR